jgi:hypothetical protein
MKRKKLTRHRKITVSSERLLEFLESDKGREWLESKIPFVQGKRQGKHAIPSLAKQRKSKP